MAINLVWIALVWTMSALYFIARYNLLKERRRRRGYQQAIGRIPCTCGHEFSKTGMFHIGDCPRKYLPRII